MLEVFRGVSWEEEEVHGGFRVEVVEGDEVCVVGCYAGGWEAGGVVYIFDQGVAAVDGVGGGVVGGGGGAAVLWLFGRARGGWWGFAFG